VAVRGSHAFQALTGGLQHACGLDADSVAWCWGEGSSGAVGPETGACPQVLSDLRCTVPVPVDTAMRFLALAAGWAHTCGVDRSGVGWCWGLGYGSQPVALSGSQIFVGVVAGAGHSCALDDSDGAWCWGDNGAGQLGIGQVGTASPDPVPVTGGLTFALLRAGGSVTCGLTPAGRAWCWGNHTDGAVGDGSDFSIQLRPAPVEVAGQLP
jgi:alpha-tubulin suppressor-like RCC1 family protein